MIDSIKKLFKPIQLSIVLLSFTACVSQNAVNVKTAGETKLITDIITSEDAKATTVTVKGNDTLTYTSNKQEFPLGLLVHFPETALDNIKTVYYPPESDTLNSIRATQLEEDGVTSRIFIALKQDLSYSIKPDDTGLHIYFSKADNPAAESTIQEVPVEKVEIRPEPLPDIAPAPPATQITSVTATPLKKNVVIDVKADGTIKNYKSFTIAGDPSRIVYDLYGLKSPYKKEQRITVKSDWVSGIRYYGHPEKIRMVLETKKAHLSEFSASPADDGLMIYVGNIPEPLIKEQAEQVVAQNLPTNNPEQKKISKDQVPQPAAVTQNDTLAWLNRIDFASEEAGKSAVIIGTTRPVDYQLTKISDKRLRLDLLDTNLPEYRNRALITTRFQSAVDRITPTHQPKTKDTVIVIELREAVPYLVKQTDNIIRVDFSASSIPPKPYEDAKLPAWKKVLAEPATGYPAASENKPENLMVPSEALAERKLAAGKLKPSKEEMSLRERLAGVAPAQRYNGEKIALDFYDTDIKNVFRIIREISGKNFAIDKNVTGKVTLTLDKPVPWDQVLDLVLKMNQLGMTMEGDIVRIATLNTLAQEEKLRQAKFKTDQAAINQQKALEPLVTAYIPINYSDAKTEILPHIQPILSATRGKASVDIRNNQIIITDTAVKIQQAREIVGIIDKVTPQVIIEARIVEANSAFTRDLGFDWGETILGQFSIGGLDIGPTTLLASNLPATIPSALVNFNFAKLGGTPFEILNAKLVASETEGKTNIISAPKVVTLDNKKAKIKQGLEVPYLERDSSGNATVRFKNVDLLLEVTPNITPDDRIVMKIFVTKNDVVDPTADQPALSTNEAQTELLVDNGDTIVIGGIVKSTIQYGEKGIPGLRQLGVLGWLFRSQSKKDQKNELLIFITPRIVKLEQKKMKI
ncbi:MAG: type IV pilus secretin PilQ [Deltaproteobacteria bacterium]|jgi:type IV pilus assembly protein PilQ|nr:type IV pilus secretin PilQ [Deltaproteobacteria bacterium]